MVIETDGFTHQFEEIYEKDKIKEKQLNELGISVLRFEDEEVMNNIENVLSVIEHYIDEFEKLHTPTSATSPRTPSC